MCVLLADFRRIILVFVGGYKVWFLVKTKTVFAVKINPAFYKKGIGNQKSPKNVRFGKMFPRPYIYISHRKNVQSASPVSMDEGEVPF